MDWNEVHHYLKSNSITATKYCTKTDPYNLYGVFFYLGAIGQLIDFQLKCHQKFSKQFMTYVMYWAPLYQCMKTPKFWCKKYLILEWGRLKSHWGQFSIRIMRKLSWNQVRGTRCPYLEKSALSHKSLHKNAISTFCVWAPPVSQTKKLKNNFIIFFMIYAIYWAPI